jgi:integrase
MLASTRPKIELVDRTAVTSSSVSDRVRLAAKMRIAESSHTVYQGWFSRFTKWVEQDNHLRPPSARRSALPADPSAVLDYLAEQGTRSSYVVASCAIRHMHITHGYRPPLEGHEIEADAVYRGFSRLVGRKVRRARAITPAELSRLIDSFSRSDRRQIRARVFITLAFFGAFRRAELSSIYRSDIREVPQGLIVYLRRSKSDPYGEGEEVAIARRGDRYCPVAAYRGWCRLLDADHPGEPYLFPGSRPGHHADESAIRRAVIAQCRVAGLDMTELSMHSFRAGFVTAAFSAGASEIEIREVTRHASVTQLAEYYRPSDPFARHAARTITMPTR